MDPKNIRGSVGEAAASQTAAVPVAEPEHVHYSKASSTAGGHTAGSANTFHAVPSPPRGDPPRAAFEYHVFGYDHGTLLSLF